MTITDTITRIDDNDGDIIATTLLNVTIMAADRRGGRRILSVADFNAFKTMLEAAEGIGPVKQIQQSAPSPEAIQSAVEAVAQAIGTTLPPNTL